MRTGDRVRHIPSNELWTVAWADKTYVMWCGWPEGWAAVSDCILIKACTDEEHWKLVRDFADLSDDPQGCNARRDHCRRYLDQRLTAPLHSGSTEAASNWTTPSHLATYVLPLCESMRFGLCHDKIVQGATKSCIRGDNLLWD